MWIHLGDADRDRLGCPTWLEFDRSRLTAREAATIQHAAGYTPEELQQALRIRVEVRDAAGAWHPWVADDTTAEPPDGSRVVVDYDAWAAAIWIGLRRAGISVLLPEVDFDIYQFRTSLTAPGGEDAGKADADPSIPPGASTP